MTVTTCALVVPERSMVKSVFNISFLNFIQIFPVTIKFLRKWLTAPCVILMVKWSTTWKIYHGKACYHVCSWVCIITSCPPHDCCWVDFLFGTFARALPYIMTNNLHVTETSIFSCMSILICLLQMTGCVCKDKKELMSQIMCVSYGMSVAPSSLL